MAEEVSPSSYENDSTKRPSDKRVKTAFLAILFADIGIRGDAPDDKRVQNLIGACHFLLSKETVRHGGKVIRTIRDEMMCTFRTADDAVRAAKAMCRKVAEQIPANKSGLFPPNLRIGIHSGPISIRSGDVFGEAVKVASRIKELAKQRQIITTGQTVNLMNPEYQAISRCIDRTTIRGKTGDLNIHELVWESDATVEMAPPLEVNARLRLRFRDHIIHVDQNRPIVTMGRQAHNDLVVDGTRVSRSHASIEYHQGGFILNERSSNGTYLMINGKQEIVKHVETPLYGQGIMGLSEKVGYDSPRAIHFSITP